MNLRAIPVNEYHSAGFIHVDRRPCLFKPPASAVFILFKIMNCIHGRGLNRKVSQIRFSHADGLDGKSVCAWPKMRKNIALFQRPSFLVYSFIKIGIGIGIEIVIIRCRCRFRSRFGKCKLFISIYERCLFFSQYNYHPKDAKFATIKDKRLCVFCGFAVKIAGRRSHGRSYSLPEICSSESYINIQYALY